MSQTQPLTKIHLTGYKSIQQLDLELRPLNILIGANGAGKSNFISLFTLLRNIMDSRLGLYVAQQGGGRIPSSFATPEEINDRPTLSPSKRFAKICGNYDKVFDGPFVTHSVGLDKLRSTCSHFNGWIEWLEGL